MQNFIIDNRKFRLICFTFFIFSINSSLAQSPLHFKTLETLKQEKDKAGSEAKKSEIIKEIDLRNAEQKEIELLNADMNKKIEVEDYLEAQAIKEKIAELKAKQANAEELRKKLETSIAEEDYETAEKYKTELLKIKPRSENLSAPVQKSEPDAHALEKIRKEKEEKEKAENEKKQQEAIEALKRQEQENIKKEIERLKQEELARAEAEKLNAKKAAEEKAEAERLAAKKVLEEKLEAERIAAQKIEAERLKIAEQKALEFSLYGYTLKDDFSDNRNNWIEETYYDRRIQLINGKMVLEGFNERLSYRTDINFPINTEKDFSVEASARWIRGEEKNGYGVDFASNYEGNKYYSFQVAAIGYYSVLYYQNNQWFDIIPWKSTSSVKRGNEPNNLKIVKEGNELLFYVNNVFLNKIPWQGGFGKDFGFRIFDKQIVEFDDFIIKGIKE